MNLNKRKLVMSGANTFNNKGYQRRVNESV